MTTGTADFAVNKISDTVLSLTAGRHAVNDVDASDYEGVRFAAKMFALSWGARPSDAAHFASPGLYLFQHVGQHVRAEFRRSTLDRL